MVLRLPTGALWGPHAAAAVAADPVRLAAAAAFWRNAFQRLGVVDFTWQHPAIAFGLALRDEWLSTLLPDRTVLVAGCPDDYLIKRSGCLASIAEISQISRLLAPAEAIDYATALLAVGLPGTVVPPEVAALGMFPARELFDAVRRFTICEKNGTEFGSSTTELLALYRQEGGLCIAPAADSYPYAPLIQTGVGCREATVSLFDRSCQRPGFNLVYEFLGSTDATLTEPSLRFDVLFRNLVTLAGLDTVLLPRLQARDELTRLWQMALTTAAPSPAALRIRDSYARRMAGTMTCSFNVGWRKTQRQFFNDACIGLLRTLLEVGAAARGAEAMLELLGNALDTLLGAHGYSPARPHRGRDVHLFADADSADTYTCLRTQARWYASRRQLPTLLAWKDRHGAVGPFPVLSPFLTYLRFHTGDAIFVGMLLRVIARFSYLVRAWETHSTTWGLAFLDVLPSTWDQARADALRDDLRRHWGTARVTRESAWQHIGLIATLRAVPGAPTWLAEPALPDPRLVECARIAVDLVEFLRAPGVLDAVGVALERTPALWLADHGFTATPGADGTNVLVKSHSFERLRLVYAQAAWNAGLR